MNVLKRIILLTLAFTTSVAAQGAFSVIFDDDPGSTIYRDASFGFADNGDYLKLGGGNNEKLPLDATRRYSGTVCGVLEYNHGSGGNWEMFIASNGWQTRDFSGYDSLVFYINGPATIPAGELPRIGLEEATSNAKTPLIALAPYVTLDGDTATWQRVSIPLSALEPFGGFSLASFKAVRFAAHGVTSSTRTLWIDLIAVLRVSGGPTPLPPLSTERLLDTLQYTAFRYFWNEANPANGLVKDRSAPGAPASIAAVGFGLSALTIGVDRGWVTRESARDRVLTTLKTFWEKPQGSGVSGTIGYRGWFYHWLDMNSATRLNTSWKSELSSIDSGLLLAGILDAQMYFSGSDSTETMVRSLADSIFHRVDWDWMASGGSTLSMGWFPEDDGYFLGAQWIGYNEAMILYILGMGATTNPLRGSAWGAWTSGYQWKTYEGYDHVAYPALFTHQYSHCWIDFRSIQDGYMRQKGITYFENSRRATLANRAYCIANPLGYSDYGYDIWGLTACDGPTEYRERGAPFGYDDGTIAPTAAISSIPFTPEESIQAAHAMYERYGANLFGQYGFRDAFNIKVNWFAADYIGIDEGPIIIMIENHLRQTVWNRFMLHPVVKAGLAAAGFQTVTGVAEDGQSVPQRFSLAQNYPNPFNPTTAIEFHIPTLSLVSLKVYDLLGREVISIVEEVLPSGTYIRHWDARGLPSGMYYYCLAAAGHRETKKMILVR
ncbi:MAG: glucoamylase family protein [Bacteroidota bacterium]